MTTGIKTLAVFLALVNIYTYFKFQPERAIAIQSFERMEREASVSATIRKFCGKILENPSSPFDTFLSRYLEKDLSPSEKPCQLSTAVKMSEDLYLRQSWAYAIRITRFGGEVLYETSNVEKIPTPLALLPIIIATIFLAQGNVPFSLGLLLISHLMFLSAFNPLTGFQIVFRSFTNLLQQAHHCLPAFILSLWACLILNRRKNFPQLPGTPMRGAAIFLGLSNPIFFVATSPIWWTHSIRTRKNYVLMCRTLLLISALGLYFFNWHWDRFSSLIQNLILPRYLALALIGSISWVFVVSPRRVPIRLAPSTPYWPAFLILCTIFALTRTFVTGVHFLSVNVIVALSLLGTEIFCYPQCTFSRFQIKLPVTLLAIWGILSIPVWAHYSTLSTMVTVLWDPSLHPNHLALFSFLSGFFVPFFTGGFANPYFEFAPFFHRTADPALLKAAMLDGMLVGSLLSPLSPVVLFPILFFGLKWREAWLTVAKLLTPPIGIALVIYSVPASNSLPILRPLTFIFLVLVSLSFYLRRKGWGWPQFAGLRSAER